MTFTGWLMMVLFRGQNKLRVSCVAVNELQECLPLLEENVGFFLDSFLHCLIEWEGKRMSVKSTSE